MDVKDAIEQAKALRAARKHQEAIGIQKPFKLKSATNADVWWFSGMAFHSLKEHDSAIHHIRQTLKLVPRFGGGWARLGNVYADAGLLEDATKALLHAVKLEPDNGYALGRLAEIASDAEDYEQQLTYLLALDSYGKATSDDLNNLGICYYNLKRFGNAIEAYHRSNAKRPSASPLFNLALIYNNSSVSQDVDAVDVLRRALGLKPGYEVAQKRLDSITPALVGLAERSIREGNSLLTKDEWFQFYLNPFELLQADHSVQLETVDAKWIQSKKRTLLHDVELDGGVLEQLGGATVDKSRVHAVVDELHNEQLREFHWKIFRCPEVLQFLTRGKIQHFLYDEGYFPVEMLESMDSEPFREWLSAPFAKQYNLVLGRALEKRAFAAVESLFDGRRWTIPEHDETCFAAAHRYIDRLIEPLSELSKKSVAEKPNVEILTGLLDGVKTENYQRHEGIIVRVLNLLPEPFREQQTDAVRYIRQMSLAAFNEHGDLDLSRAVLALSKKFAFKNASLRARLEEDFKELETLTKEERKFEAKLKRGDKPLQITKEGVRDGDTIFPVKSIISMRYGISVSRVASTVLNQFILAFVDDDARTISFDWTPQTEVEKNQEYFNQLIQATMVYIMPSIVEKLEARLGSGERVNIGNCVLQAAGIGFETQGWVFTKNHLIPWSRVKTDMDRGQLQIFDGQSPDIKTSMPLKDTPNAGALEFLAIKLRS